MMSSECMFKKNDSMLMSFGSIIVTLVTFRAIYNQYLPYQLRETIERCTFRYAKKLANIFSPYLHIIFEEYTGDRFKRNELYTAIETYLSESSSMKATGMKANPINDGKSLVLSIADNEEVTDEYKGAKVWWSSDVRAPRSQTITFFPRTDEKRHYKLTFSRGHRQLITESYLNYVIEEGNTIAIRKRQRRLYTNIKDSNSDVYSKSLWGHVEFKHPAHFETLAMVPTKKQAILDDLNWFAQSKDYYAKVGKPWKRGYLLYGPPGTGKSTMIAAMANFMEYDVYDLELTAVKDNTHLKRLLIETTSKSIIVIEDIDCSLDLTGQRKTKKEKEKDEDKDKEGDDAAKKKLKEMEAKKSSEVSLSGLLNFIDGIWSACGEERLIVFTTNYIEKLDPALIRRGRMDLHIELSYCCFDAFMMLAKIYLDLESHCLFDKVRELLEETNVAPADVAENLMPRKVNLDVDACMEGLVKALEKAKEEERLKQEEKKRSKEEKESEEKEEESRESSDEEKKDS